MEKTRLRLAGKVALVTGAGSSGSGVGTGKATAYVDGQRAVTAELTFAIGN